MSDGRSTAVRGTVDGGGGTVSISPNGLPVVGLTISGTFVQTLAIEELIDGADPTAAQVFTAAGVAASATISAPGRYLVASAGRSSIQVRQTAYTSGTATIVMYATLGAVGGSGGGGGGGGAATIADGADVTQGTTTDAAAATDTSNTTIVAFWKRLLSRLTTLLPQTASGLKVDNSAVTQPVSGTVTLGAGSATVGNVGVNKIPGTISAANSSTTPLTSGSVFTGTGEDISGFAAVVVNVFADQAGTLAPQFSSDGTHWDFAGSHAITASTGAMFVFRPGAQFWRVVYTNGGTNQGAFRLQTVYHLDDVDVATAAALGAGMSNPTTIQVGADWMVQTGGTSPATWAPAKADSSNRPVVASDDGSLSTLGTTTDAGVITDASGTGIAFLRGAIKMWITFLSRLPAALVSGRLDVNLGAAPAAVTIGTNAALVTGSATIGAVTQASGPWTVNGPGANQAAVSGNPTWVGGGTTAAGGNLQSLIVESAANPNLKVALCQGGSQAALINTGDAIAAGVGLQTTTLTEVFNGTNWDRLRNNIDASVLASGARTTTQTSADIVAYNCQGIIVTLDMTGVGTGSVTVTINYKDPASGKYILLLSGVAITTNITGKYLIDPRVPAAANVSAQSPIGRVIQVVVTANNANPATYSLGSTLVPC